MQDPQPLLGVPRELLEVDVAGEISSEWWRVPDDDLLGAEVGLEGRVVVLVVDQSEARERGHDHLVLPLLGGCLLYTSPSPRD